MNILSTALNLLDPSAATSSSAPPCSAQGSATAGSSTDVLGSLISTILGGAESAATGALAGPLPGLLSSLLGGATDGAASDGLGGILSSVLGGASTDGSIAGLLA